MEQGENIEQTINKNDKSYKTTNKTNSYIDEEVKRIQEENTELKKHSTSIQLVNKDLMLELKQNKENCEKLEEELEKLKKSKDSMEQYLEHLVVTNAEKVALMEAKLCDMELHRRQTNYEIGNLGKILIKSEEILAEIANEKSEVARENATLKENLSETKKKLEELLENYVAPEKYKSLDKENLILKNENNELRLQIDDLLEKLKGDTIAPPDGGLQDVEKARQEKLALQSIIDDLQSQLKNLMQVPAVAPAEDFNCLIKDLTKKLEAETQRADDLQIKSQELKTGDDSALLAAELKEIMKKIKQVTSENDELKEMNAMLHAKSDELENKLLSKEDEIEENLLESAKIKELNNVQKEELRKIKEHEMSVIDENGETIRVTDWVVSDIPREGSINTKEKPKEHRQIEDLENELNKIKKDLQQALAMGIGDLKLADENGILKKELVELKQQLSKLEETHKFCVNLYD